MTCDFSSTITPNTPMSIVDMAQTVIEIASVDIKEMPGINQEIPVHPWTGNRYLDASHLLSNLTQGQELRIRLQERTDLLKLVQTTDLAPYAAIGDCHNRIDIPCGITCISTTPTFTNVNFKFNRQFQIGVQRCLTTERFYNVGIFTRRWAESKRALEMFKNIAVWNDVMCDAINNPGPILNNKFRCSLGATTFVQVGTTPAESQKMIIGALKQAVDYYKGTFGVEPIIYTSTAGKDLMQRNLLELQQTVGCCGMTFNPAGEGRTTAETMFSSNQPDTGTGFFMYEGLRQFLNQGIHILKDNVMLTGGLTASEDRSTWLNPFEQEVDGANHVYFLFTHPDAAAVLDVMIRDFFQSARPCDGDVESYGQLWIQGDAVLFPELNIVLDAQAPACPSFDLSVTAPADPAA